VTSDAGPLIALSKLQHLHLLPALYQEVLIPSPVYEEAGSRGTAAGYTDVTAIEQTLTGSEFTIVDTRRDVLLPALNALPLGHGERHAIHLALQRGSDWLLVDDAQARAAASALRLGVKGTLGILAQAYRAGLLTPQGRDSLFQTLLDRDDIWLDGHSFSGFGTNSDAAVYRMATPGPCGPAASRTAILEP
jgi:predicted nucleic acid-binding protein